MATKNVQLVLQHCSKTSCIPARIITNIKLVLQQIRLLTGLNIGCKTRNIAIQLVLQQCCKTSCTFFFCLFFRTFTEKEKVLVHTEAFSTRSDSGKGGEMAEAAEGKWTAVLFSVYLSFSFFQ